MSFGIEVSKEELALLIEALDDAVLFREGRFRALGRASRSAARKAGVEASGDAGKEDQRQRQEYHALAQRLRAVPPI